MGFDGGGTAGTVVRMIRCNESFFEHVHIRNAPATLLHGSELWNCHFSNIFFHDGGNGDTNAVLLLDDMNESGGNTNTVLFSDIEWEGNLGTCIKLTGTSSPNINPAAHIFEPLTCTSTYEV